MSPTSYHCSTPRYSIISPNRASSTAENLYLASAEVQLYGRGRNSGVLKWGLTGSALAGEIALVPLVPVLKKRAMRATTILKKDHRMVSGLLMTLEMTPKFNGIVRKALFNQIRQSLVIHTQVEEEIFYPAIRNLMFGGENTKIDEAYREHQTVKD